MGIMSFIRETKRSFHKKRATQREESLVEMRKESKKLRAEAKEKKEYRDAKKDLRELRRDKIKNSSVGRAMTGIHNKIKENKKRSGPSTAESIFGGSQTRNPFSDKPATSTSKKKIKRERIIEYE